MWYLGIELIVMLLLILLASILFTNALEYFGHRVGFSAGVTGSIFAAIATALPETMVPLIALLMGTKDAVINEDIGIGAILGAPLMLSTLSTFMMALFAFKRRRFFGRIIPEKIGFVRDLNFFILAFLLAFAALYLPLEPRGLRLAVSILLIGLYLLYLTLTFRASKQLVVEGHGVVPDEPLLLARLGLKSTKKLILAQMVLGFVLLLCGAKGFINGVETISQLLSVSALLLSLLIIPLATELPEKVNSILWVRKGKDTLAFGNITGAMVFQGTLLPALGVTLGAWQPSREILTGMVITLLAALWLRFNASKKGLLISMLMVNGVLYGVYVGLSLWWVANA